MPAQRQTGGRMVEHDVFALAGQGQLQRVFMNRRLAQQARRTTRRRGGPHLLAPVACK
jgi:hypothetical protein